MKTVLFRNHIKSHLLISGISILIGALMAFFGIFPADDLWGFSYFGYSTIAFMVTFSTLIALFSTKQFVAGLHVALFVFFTYYITGIFRRVLVVIGGANEWSYVFQGFGEELGYAVPYAFASLVMGVLLWYQRYRKGWCIFIRVLPLIVAAIETIIFLVQFISLRQGLFILILDGLCTAVCVLVVIFDTTYDLEYQGL